MTATQQSARLMIIPFPVPGPQVRLAYRELNLAVNGTEEQKKQIGNPAMLPRPWEPATCLDAELRHQVWQWLEEVVAWLNHEYSWDVGAMIPTCWPAHPHLVHEIAVVADQRRRAGLAMTSDALEEWHRYCMPAFGERMRSRLKAHCEDDHVAWPGRSRHSQHTSERDTNDREDLYVCDIDALTGRAPRQATTPAAPRLGLVDLETGEIQSEFTNPDDSSGPED
ncbi:MAG: hypothetical protein L0H93_05535 [Nocardioides sp.]|nr:hypothetical protein [Nocardioides sp.]